ncbi:MAG: DUF4003 domain-containing protein [Methanomassiliicoccaceae archaeon]|nr:DUF4003 domain-containing protein [Methanomassiliicoccaceae archaeon]
MKHGTRWKIELFADNVKKAKRGLGMNSAMAKRLVALLYTVDGKPVDQRAVMSSRAVMKSNVGVFSVFRGNSSILIAAMTALKGDPQTLFDHTAAVYEMMKDAGFWRSDFLAVAAFMVAANEKPENYQMTADRMRSIYEGIKSKHRLFVGADDCIFVAMLALSGVDPKVCIERVGQFYGMLGPEFLAKNSVLMLTQIMTAGEMQGQAAAERVLALRFALKAKKVSFDRAYVLPLLGVLALLPDDVNTIAQDIEEAISLLKTHKVGFFITKQERLMYAAAIAASGYAEETEGGIAAAVSTSVINMIIAAQMATYAAVSGMAASTAAHSG